MVVVMERSWGKHQVGDVAGFEDHIARQLIRNGAARLYVTEVETADAVPDTVEDPMPEEPEEEPFPGYLLVKWQAKNRKWYPDKIDAASEHEAHGLVDMMLASGKRIRTGNGSFVTPQAYELISQGEYAEASE